MSKSKSLIYLSMFIVMTIISFFYFRDSPAPDKVDLTTLDPNLYDQSWLTNDSCEVACWHGLKPGVTSKEDSLLAINELPFIASNKTEDFGRIVNYLCKVPETTGCVRMTYDNGNLEYLYVYPNYPITMEQAVEKLGNPDWYVASPTDPSATGCILSLVWKEKQLELKYEEYRSDIPFWRRSLCKQIQDNNGKIPKSLFVSNALYMPLDKLDGIENHNAWVGFEN